jgi:hypothetical protein
MYLRESGLIRKVANMIGDMEKWITAPAERIDALRVLVAPNGNATDAPLGNSVASCDFAMQLHEPQMPASGYYRTFRSTMSYVRL